MKEPAYIAWEGLFGYVILADTILLILKKTQKNSNISYKTLSTAFNDALIESDKGKILSLAWVGLTLHLFKSFLPKKIQKLDPATAIVTYIYNRI